MGADSTAGTAPGAFPLLGHTLSMLYDPLSFFTSLPDHGDLVRIRIGPFPAIVVCTPELVREVLVNDRIFDKAGPFFDRARDAFGDGLATCPAQPAPAAAAFSPTHLPSGTVSRLRAGHDQAHRRGD